jgi:hypothetical protein
LKLTKPAVEYPDPEFWIKRALALEQFCLDAGQATEPPTPIAENSASEDRTSRTAPARKK